MKSIYKGYLAGYTCALPQIIGGRDCEITHTRKSDCERRESVDLSGSHSKALAIEQRLILLYVTDSNQRCLYVRVRVSEE